MPKFEVVEPDEGTVTESHFQTTHHDTLALDTTALAVKGRQRGRLADDWNHELHRGLNF